MRGLTLHRPWTWTIFHAPEGLAKRIENRTTPPPSVIQGERIALHAGKTWDEECAPFARLHGLDIPRRFTSWEPTPGALAQDLHREGHIVGLARVYGWIRGAPGRLQDFRGVSQETAERLANDPWFFGEYGWLLDRVMLLRPPVAHRGAQGLWIVSPAAVLAIREQEPRC